jgi:hypothetical protein
LAHLLRGINHIMVCRRNWLAIWLLVSALGACPFAAPAPAQDFRIDTEIFVGDDKEPAAETLTIFAQGMIYDFLLTEPAEMTMLDTVRGRFTLMDPARRVKCGLGTLEVHDQTLALATHATQSRDALFAFAAKPQFETKVEDYEENGQLLTRIMLKGKPLEYAIVAREPERPEAVTAFRYFADEFAQLNSLRAGNLPAGARLEVNQALFDRKLIPVEVTRTISASNPLGKKIVVKSRHLVNWSLSGEDRKKIDRAGTALAEFKSVSFEEYRASAGKPAGNVAKK